MIRMSLIVVALAFALAACAGASSDVAIDTDPFSFVPTVGNTASFFTITNNGDADDVLLSADSDLFGRVELHETVMEDGAAQMVEQTDGIPIPAGESVVLEPGGLHVMLLEGSEELAAGDEITITLVFEGAGEVEITSLVRERGEGDPPGMQMDDMDGDMEEG